MCSGNHDRSRIPQKMFAHSLGQRAVPHLSLEHRFELDVTSRNRVAHDDERNFAGDVFGVIAGQGANLLRREERAHRRIHVLVRSLHVVPFSFEQRGQCRHRCSAYADEMNRHSTPASSIVTRGLPFAATRARTPNGSVTRAPRVWPDGKPCTTGPLKSFRSSASTPLADGSPRGSSQSMNSPRMIADARSSTPANRSWVIIRSIRNGRSPTSSIKST